MRSTRATARFAGVLYLLSGIPGAFSYLYVPGTLIVPGDAAATARRITDSALTYRLGIVADVVGQIVLLYLALTLYDLLKDVDRRQARAMVALVAVGVAVEIANAFNLLAPLVLLSGADFLSVFTKAQLDGLTLGFLQVRNGGLNLAQVFWGLWLLPFGVLVIRSGYFPKVLGVLLIIACFAYLAQSLSFVVLPARAHLVIHVTQPIGGIAEGAMMLWLVIKGAKVPTAEAAVSPSV